MTARQDKPSLDQRSASRRSFLKSSGAAATGLVLGFYLPPRGPRGMVVAQGAEPFAPNAFVRISPDDVVTVLVNKSEMGQGVYTSLPMILAEELDADWTKIEVESAPATPEYNHTGFGMYITGGSSSVTSSWVQFRNAGATARTLLVEAAAAKWNVSPSSLRTEDGRVIHEASGTSASYGELSGAASRLPVPENVPLKDPSKFRIVGTNVKRVEGRDKVTGQAEFSLDVKLPGLLTAVVAHPPVCGGKVASWNADTSRAMPGVVKVKEISTGVAVIAKDFWSARKAREALEIKWDLGSLESASTESLRAQYRKLADTPGLVAEDVGRTEAKLEVSARTVEATYEVPYLAHAPMEPLNAVAHVHDGGCDIWAGTQFQTMDQMVASKITGVPAGEIRIHTTLLGGGFGRRATPNSDFVMEAVEIANGEGVPIKTIWTREEDIQCGYYRPMFVHKLRASLDADGKPEAWHQRAVGQSIMQGTAFESMMENGIDPSSIEGAAHMPYAIPHRRIEVHNTERVVSVLWWRSVGHTHTGFVNESFLDELAHAGGHDPFELRRELLKDEPRHLAVLELAAEKAGWGKPLAEGRAHGIAMRQSFDSFVAEVAEVSLSATNEVIVHKVTAAVDCGIAVNPWNVEAQIESGILYGLTAALYGEVTLQNGRVQQSNFHDYPMLRMDRAPEIEVHIVKSDAAPTGVGEPGVPPIAPAVANALFTLTGKRIRKLPIRMEEAV